MLKKHLLIALLICLLHSANAQQVSVSVEASNQPLSGIVEHLSATYKLQFAYSSDQVDLSRTVTVSVKNVTLEQALNKIFSQTGIAFMISGDVITLYRDVNYRVTISGYVREKGTGELLIGVIVGTNPSTAGAVTNAYGFYSITVPPGDYVLSYNYIGFQPKQHKISANSTQELSIELHSSTDLDAVVVTAANNALLKANIFTINLPEIKSIPMILGERDAVKYAMLSAGIQKGNEGNSYLYVRGGGPDQNLILIDDAVIYNAYHFLGLSSLFSGSELRNAELIKGGFSSKYGGRLSSVLDMSMKDGNREQFGLEATAGVISSKIMIEGPIVKNKSSFLVSARKSYIDKLSSLVSKDASTVLGYGYYDLHAKISTDIGKRDRLMLSGYWGHDMLQTSGEENVEAKDDGVDWGNRTASLRWSHQFSSQLFVNTTLSKSYYNSRTAFAETDGESNVYNTSSIESSIDDNSIKTDLDYYAAEKHHFKFGLGYTQHNFSPTTSYHNYVVDTTYSKGKHHSTNEAFGYAEWGYKPTSKWNIVSGIRMSYYQYLSSYVRPEPRLSIFYTPGKNWELSTSYSSMNQYIHLISTFSGFGFPNDIWVSSDENLKPQQSQLITLGVSKQKLANGHLSMSVEGYYKQMDNVVGLRENASLFQVLLSSYFGTRIDKWSELTTQGKGQSYGIEYMLRKSGKHFQGWISYTLSKTTQQFDLLNNQNWFPATFDRRHDLGIYLSYRTAKHWKFSSNFVYGTGNAISLPVGEYYTSSTSPFTFLSPSFPLFDYESKNNYRMKPYHRLDISIQYFHLIAKKIESTIEFSVYNVYNRANPFFYQIEQESTPSGNGKRTLKQISLFPIMPSISWSIKI